MENRSGTVKYHKQNFLLDETKLRKIVDVIRVQSKKLNYETYIEFYIEREGDYFYTTQNLDDIISDDNAVGKSIRVLTIELYKSEPEAVDKNKSREERKHLIYMAFSTGMDTKIRVSVASEDRDWTSVTIVDIETQIKRILSKRGISNLLYYADFVIAPLIIYLGVMIGSYIFDASIRSDITRADIVSMTPNEQITKILSILIDRGQFNSLSFAGYWIVSWGLGMLVLIFRPISHWIGKSRTSFFHWGDIVQLHNKIEQRNMLIKWGVLVALLVSIAGSIAGTLIMK